MIDAISDWASGLITVLIITTLIEMLLPNNKTKKYIKMVIGVYIVFCIISPLVSKETMNNIENEIFSLATTKEIQDLPNIQSSHSDNILDNIQSDNQSITSNIEQLYIEEFEKDIISKVQSLGYKVNKCNVDIQIDSTKENAGINKINLNVSKKQTNKNNLQDSNQEKNIITQNVEIENVQKVEISINNSQTGENNENTIETKDTKEIKKYLCNYYEITEEKINIVES